MAVKTMNVQEFIQEYGNFVQSYKEYDNGIILINFSQKNKIMWLKKVVCERMDMKIIDGSPVSGRYWFEPNN